MQSCNFRWARHWGWPTTELHCTYSCKYFSFSPLYSHCTTRLIILKLVQCPRPQSFDLLTPTIFSHQWPLPLLGLTFYFLHYPTCPPFLLLLPRGEGLWKNVFNDEEGVNGFCGCEFENVCSVTAHSGEWLSKPKATCRSQVKVPSSDGQTSCLRHVILCMIATYSFLIIWSATTPLIYLFLRGWKKSLTCYVCNVCVTFSLIWLTAVVGLCIRL